MPPLQFCVSRAPPSFTLRLFRLALARANPGPWLRGLAHHWGAGQLSPWGHCPVAHHLREVQDLEKEFPEGAEVTAFVRTVAPQLALAMRLRTQPISDAGARTRGILMSVLHTLKKRQVDVVGHLKRVLDHLAQDIHQDPWPLLFPEDPTRH